MENKAYFQDNYPDEFSQCYGCGRLNNHGLQIKSFWEGDVAVCRFSPKPFHTAVEGYVYGGLIASVIDCHATGTGAAAIFKRNETDGNFSTEYPRCVTASLNVEYLKPTSIKNELILRADFVFLTEKKIKVNVKLYSDNQLCAKAEVVVVQISESWMKKHLKPKA